MFARFTNVQLIIQPLSYAPKNKSYRPVPNNKVGIDPAYVSYIVHQFLRLIKLKSTLLSY